MVTRLGQALRLALVFVIRKKYRGCWLSPNSRNQVQKYGELTQSHILGSNCDNPYLSETKDEKATALRQIANRRVGIILALSTKLIWI